MCGRYYMGDEDIMLVLRAALEEANRRSLKEGVKTSGEAFPADLLPVIAPDRNQRPGLFAMRWGYAGRDGKRIINARSETAREKPLFADGMARRRCAIPARSYFEWARNGKARGTKYSIAPAGEELFYLAGLYHLTESGPEFAVLTRPPTESIAFIHDRMPVMLPGSGIGDWIDPRADADKLLPFALTDVSFHKLGAEQLPMALE